MALPHPPHGQAAKPRHNRHPKSSSSSSSSSGVASCVVATLFLVFVVIVVLILFFTIFRPKDPKISVTGVQLPSFSILPSNASSNSSSFPTASSAANTSLLSFTFSQYVAVNNPNRASFSHYDSSLELLYTGNQVGFMFIPAGKISPGHTQYMAATFAVQSFPLSFSPSSSSSIGDGVYGNGIYGNLPGGGGGGVIPGYYGGRVGPTLEIESRMELGGRVRFLHFFTHNVAATADCRVTIAVSDGSVLGFHC